MSERDYNEIFKQNFLTSVACEIRFVPLLLIQEKIPLFQHKIRENLPALKRDITISIPDFTSKPVEPFKWIFASQDNNKSLTVTFNRISFVVAQFDNFEPFYQEFIDYFKEFFKLCEIDEYTRIGLRYINEFPLNEIKTSESDTILKYFTPIIDHQTIQNNPPTQFNFIYRRKISDSILVTRNIYNKYDNGIEDFIIDIDSYKQEKVLKKDLENSIKNVQNLLIKEFHNNVTENTLSIMRGPEQ